MPNRVLGIDPGYDRLGWAVLERFSGKESVIASGCIETDRKAEGAARLLAIGNELKAVIKKHSPAALAIEKLFFNQNVTTALKVAEARGVVLLEAARAGLSVHEYSPQDVKIAVTGYGKASKSDVERMVEKLVKLPAKQKRLDDELDAVALGITHLASEKSLVYK
jgi:crossover junction endodeoxyribonuclease RuvC